MSNALRTQTDITNPPPQDSMMQSLERLARDPAIPTERIVQLYQLAERREQALLKRAFHTDMNLLQRELTQVQRDKPNPAFRSKYATYDQLDRAARPLYTKYGFDITFGTAPASRPDYIQVVCRIGHSMGYYEEHPLEGPVSTQGSQGNRAGATPIQAVGIAVAYLKRYLLQMVLNLVTADNPDDNDGNGQQIQTRDRDPLAKYIDWVDRFEMAANDLPDSDAAKELMTRETVVRMLTEIPAGSVRQRFMALRQEIERKWLTPIGNAPENEGKKDEEIEGL